MSEEHVEVVREIFDSWAAGDFRGGVEHLDPHVTFVVRPPFPEFGVFVGPDGIREYMSVFLEHWARLTIEAESLQAAGDTVVVTAIQHAQGRSSGIAGDTRYFQLFTFRGGKILRIESILDEAEALEAAGLRE